MENRKVLVIHSDDPRKVRGGDSLAVSNFIKGFKELGYQIELVFFDANFRGKYKRDDNCWIFEKPQSISIKNIIRCMFNYSNYIYYRFYSKELNQFLKKKILNEEYSLVYIEHGYMGLNFPIHYYPRANKVFYSISILEYLVWNPKINNSKLPVWTKKILTWWNIKSEIRILNNFPAKFSYGLEECEEINKQITTNKVKYLPIPLNIHDYPFVDWKPKNLLSLIILGNMSWYPNSQGVNWFLDSLWPAINDQIQIEKINIIGKGLPDQIIKKLDPFHNIEYLGYVENLDEIFKNSPILLVPLQIGGGTRLKILETMCRGIPIITSRIGREGIHCPQNCLFEFQNAQELKTILQNISKNPETGKISAQNARKFIEMEHSIQKSLQQLGVQK